MFQPYRLERPLLTLHMLEPMCSLLGLPLPAKGHITLAWCEQDVDWELPVFAADAQPLNVAVSHPRLVAFGPTGGIAAIAFDSPTLSARHADLAQNGATWAYPPYQPHVSLGPYAGPLPTGPLPFPARLGFGPERRRLP